MKIAKIGLFINLIVLLSGCATNYKLIEPSELTYKGKSIEKDIILEYKYNLLERKYARKENRSGIELVAIKIINNSEQDLTFGEDVKLSINNGNELYILDKEKVYKQLKQNIAPYLLYLLIPPISVQGTSESVEDFEINYAPAAHLVGLTIFGLNFFSVLRSNDDFYKELFDNYLDGKMIKKGETISGLIGIKSNSYDEIILKVK